MPSARERAKIFASDMSMRKKLFEELLKHVRAGFCEKNYKYMAPQAIERAFLEFPEEFNREEYEEALRDGYAGWEQIGRRQAEGRCLGNSRAWSFAMSHKFGWSDRVKVEAQTESNVNVSIVSYSDSTSKPVTT